MFYFLIHRTGFCDRYKTKYYLPVMNKMAIIMQQIMIEIFRILQNKIESNLWVIKCTSFNNEFENYSYLRL